MLAVSEAVLFGLANVASGIAMVAFVALVVVSKTHIGSVRFRPSDLALGGWFFAVVVPLLIIAGMGGYIEVANTGYYATPADYRNSPMFLNICWFFVTVVAPAISVIGFAMIGAAVLRSRHARQFRMHAPRQKGGASRQDHAEPGRSVRRPPRGPD